MKTEGKTNSKSLRLIVETFLFIFVIGLKSKKMRALSYYLGEGYFWIRIFGFGIHIKNVQENRLLFSERNNLRKRIQIGRYSIRTLQPDKI